MQKCVGVHDYPGRIKLSRVLECIFNVKLIFYTDKLGNTNNKN
jgi:hypothetical protein